MLELRRIKEALLTVSDNVGHYRQLRKEYPYIVWAEDGQANAVWSNGKMTAQALQGTVDLFTKEECDPKVGSIQRALADAGASFRLESVQYEEDINVIHYEWVWELWQ